MNCSEGEASRASGSLAHRNPKRERRGQVDTPQYLALPPGFQRKRETSLARIIHEGVGRNEQLAMLPELRSLTKRRMAHNVLERV
jgi:hypothetical protein